MEEKTRQILDREFKKSSIKTKPGRGNTRLSYVEGANYIRRLNEAFGGEWSFEIVEYQILESEVIVRGRITVLGADGSIIKEQWGGHPRNRGSDLGDVLKSATTDALKKCASLFGVGLHLYSDAPDEEVGVERSTSGAGEASAPPSGQAKWPSDPHGPLTQRQKSALWAIAKVLGWSVEELRAAAGKDLGDLTKAEASALIDELKERSIQAGGAAS